MCLPSQPTGCWDTECGISALNFRLPKHVLQYFDRSSCFVFSWCFWSLLLRGVWHFIRKSWSVRQLHLIVDLYNCLFVWWLLLLCNYWLSNGSIQHEQNNNENKKTTHAWGVFPFTKTRTLGHPSDLLSYLDVANFPVGCKSYHIVIWSLLSSINEFAEPFFPETSPKKPLLLSPYRWLPPFQSCCDTPGGGSKSQQHYPRPMVLCLWKAAFPKPLRAHCLEAQGRVGRKGSSKFSYGMKKESRDFLPVNSPWGPSYLFLRNGVFFQPYLWNIHKDWGLWWACSAFDGWSP